MVTKRDVNRRLKQIKDETEKLNDEKRQLLKKLRDLNHIAQIEKPKIYLGIKKSKYIVANARVADRVYSIYIGDKKKWGGDDWEKNKKLMDYATKKMKLKLKEKVKW